jgi:hypothetical protein
VAKLPLTGAHRRGRVALGELDRVEALGDRALHVLRGHVLAHADEAAPFAGICRQRARRAALARDRSDRFDAGGQVRRNEDAEVGVVLDTGAGLCEQRVRRLAAAGRDEQVAVDALSVHDESAHAPLAALRDELARSRLPEVDDARQVDTDLGQVVRDLEPLVVGRENDRTAARLDREVPDETAHAAGKHHADEVVAREDERLLDGACGDDDLLRAEAVENGAGVDRNEAAFPDPEGTGRGEHLDAVELQCAHARVLVDEDGTGARCCLGERRSATGLSASDDEHARLAVLSVVPAGVPRVLGELPEPGGAPQELLVERPEFAGSDERAVVEAHRGERTADLVRHGHEVEVERPADVLAFDDRAFANRLGADADVRDAVHCHHAVRAVPRATE